MSNSVPEAEIERRIDSFVHAFRARGLKVTHQRTEIFREIASTTEHPDALTLFERVRARIPSVSVDTIYRTLATLESCGVISKVQSWSPFTRYDANVAPHHHFVCDRCGLVRDFEDDHFDTLVPPDGAVEWGEVRRVQVSLVGLCAACRAESGSTSESGKPT